MIRISLVGLQCVIVTFPGHKDLLFQAGATRLDRWSSWCNITSITKCSSVAKRTSKWLCMQQTDEQSCKVWWFYQTERSCALSSIYKMTLKTPIGEQTKTIKAGLKLFFKDFLSTKKLSWSVCKPRGDFILCPFKYPRPITGIAWKPLPWNSKSVLRRWFCCCWLFVYCYSHCWSL